MKKILFILIILFVGSFAFAENLVLKTGNLLAVSTTDYFYPSDISVLGSQCSVTSIRNVEKDLWCISITAHKSSIPVTYDYYVKVGDSITLRRITEPMKELSLVVLSIDWNTAVLDIQ